MDRIARFLTGRRTAWLAFFGGFVVVGALFALLPQPESGSTPTTGLPASAESQRVAALLERFPGADRTVAIVVYDREAGLTEADRTAIGQRAAALADRSVVPQAVRPQVGDDGRVALVAVPLDADRVQDDPEGVASALRSVARTDLPAGLTARITGPVGFQADVVNAFAGADLRLLIVTAAVVAVLLIVTYRSPLLWIVPLVVVGAADGLARVVVGAVTSAAGVPVDASVSGIQSVLVFGAGTNYALLLISRYREELRRRDDPHDAMRAAVRAAGPTIAASGGTVALSLLTLLLGELSGNRALGLACAIGVAIAILAAVLWLPAALVVFGRRLFWPFVPRHEPGREGEVRGVWSAIGRRVARRPRTLAVVAVLGIVALGSGLVGFRFGLSQTEQLLGDPESVQAQAVLDRSFSAGTAAQTVVLAPAGEADRVAAIARDVDGVDRVTPGATSGGRTELDLQLAGAPASDAAFASVRDLRAAFAVEGGRVADALVGGSDATAYDQRVAQQRDQAVVVPAILVVVFLILALLLRSLVAPVLLLASVLATYLASLGLGNLLFQHVFGFPGFDVQVPLFAFLFLVALGVDYNIFLTARAREERAVVGTREGIVRALGATGGVITSAGVLLAAVFVVLGVLPVVALAQIGALVCIGVLLDTLVVRTLLVPALVLIAGDRFWWPSRRDAVLRRGEAA
ncbi:MMPL family transporter [Amnibacterium setariae]|uniref:MMPL family transporter n=1 Tax=Amnibacterium setariae TaxID=2306585 RepID=A0A3A1U217_9MICO|nr:MMPL family transporter [Amnibacterium setariae]RIX27877.1 MMPL family transporter [Amnibacterium setariae]